MGLNINTSQPPQAQSDFVWTSGAIEPFTFISTADHVATFTIGSGSNQRTIQYDYDPALPVTDLILVAKAVNGTSSAEMSNLVLDGVAVDALLSVSTGGTTYQEVQPLGADLSDGWTLTGNMKLTWTSAPSSSGLEFMIKAVHELPDLDIDSDNTNGMDAPDRSSLEESVENIAGDDRYPGKVVLVSSWDGDGDGLPDYVDGFNWTTVTADDDTSVGTSFVPVVLSLPAYLDPNTARMQITYDASDPALVHPSMDSPFVLPEGSLRLWRRDGSRDARSVLDGGDYVAPGEYQMSDLGIVSGGSVMLYLEAVRPSASTADQAVTVRVMPDGDAFALEDTVRVTAVRMDLLAQDLGGAEGTETYGFLRAGMPGGQETERSGSAPGAFQSYIVKIYDPRANIVSVAVADQPLTVTRGAGYYATDPFLVLGPEDQALLAADEFLVLETGAFNAQLEYPGDVPPDSAVLESDRWAVTTTGTPSFFADAGRFLLSTGGPGSGYFAATADPIAFASDKEIDAHFTVRMGDIAPMADAAIQLKFGDGVREWVFLVGPSMIGSIEQGGLITSSLPSTLGNSGDLRDGAFHTISIHRDIGQSTVSVLIDETVVLPGAGGMASTYSGIGWGDERNDVGGTVEYDSVRWSSSGPSEVLASIRPSAVAGNSTVVTVEGNTALISYNPSSSSTVATAIKPGSKR